MLQALGVCPTQRHMQFKAKDTLECTLSTMPILCILRNLYLHNSQIRKESLICIGGKGCDIITKTMRNLSK